MKVNTPKTLIITSLEKLRNFVNSIILSSSHVDIVYSPSLPLVPSNPFIHCSNQVLQTTSSVLKEQIDILAGRLTLAHPCIEFFISVLADSFSLEFE